MPIMHASGPKTILHSRCIAQSSHTAFSQGLCSGFRPPSSKSLNSLRRTFVALLRFVFAADVPKKHGLGLPKNKFDWSVPALCVSEARIVASVADTLRWLSCAL